MFEDTSQSDEDVATFYNYLIIDAFKENKKNRRYILDSYMHNSRKVLEQYLSEDYKLLKNNIKSNMKPCVSRKEIQDETKEALSILDSQIKIINSCVNHKDFIMKSIFFMQSKNKDEKKLYNYDLYNAVLDGLIEEILTEQDDGIDCREIKKIIREKKYENNY